MKTTVVSISMPQSMRLFVERQTEDDGYASVSEYLRELIRREQKASKKPRPQAPEPARSSEKEEMSRADYEEFRRKVFPTVQWD